MEFSAAGPPASIEPARTRDPAGTAAIKGVDIMNFQYFTYQLQDTIATLTINRQEVRNALNGACWEEIDAFISHVNASDDVRLAVFTGAGEKAFAAGADISALRARTMVEALCSRAQTVLRHVAECEKPVIAALNGVAFGGGCELAMACDIRIAADHARLGLPEVGLGVIPGAGGTQRLAKLVGLGRAKELILTGRAVSAQEALQIGLVNRVVPAASLMDAVRETAGSILEKGPLAVRLAKKAVEASLSTDTESGMRLELLSYALAIASEDRLEGTDAFLNKRKPDFQGR